RNSSGALYVADVMNRNVLVFDSTGSHVRTLGRAGEGPGEFRFPATVGIGVDDSVRVFDSQLWRVTVFAPTDSLIRVESVPQKQTFGQSHEAVFTEDGTLVYLGYDKYQASIADELGQRQQGLARGLSTVEFLPPGSRSWSRVTDVSGIEVFVDLDRGSLTDVWFSRRSFFTTGPVGHLWIGDGGSGVVALIKMLDGSTVCALDNQRTPRPVSQEARAAFLNAEDIPTTNPDQVRRMRASRRGVSLPDQLPIVRGLAPVAGGGVLAGFNGTDSASAVWYRVSARGAIEAQFQLPVTFTPYIATRHIVIGVSRRTDDVQVVELYRPPTAQ
ncbi:MAG: 6-bladed beta-propeller, partial [Gemmatimonadetes bacterium]|nr:6-bladed beta-propeller [Gemmatimonadota bacterium]